LRKTIFMLFSILLFFSITYVSYTYIKIKQTASIKPPKNVSYIIVLGAKVNGDQLSKALLYVQRPLKIIGKITNLPPLLLLVEKEAEKK